MAGSNKTKITPPRWLLAELTYACPLQCPYCDNPIDYAKYQSELDTEDWKRVLSQARKMGAVSLFTFMRYARRECNFTSLM